MGSTNTLEGQLQAGSCAAALALGSRDAMLCLQDHGSHVICVAHRQQL